MLMLQLQKRVPVEVGLLRLFYALIQRVDESSLAECWPLLLSLLKEGLQINLTPPAVFLLLTYELFLLDFNDPVSYYHVFNSQ